MVRARQAKQYFFWQIWFIKKKQYNFLLTQILPNIRVHQYNLFKIYELLNEV